MCSCILFITAAVVLLWFLHYCCYAIIVSSGWEQSKNMSIELFADMEKDQQCSEFVTYFRFLKLTAQKIKWTAICNHNTHVHRSSPCIFCVFASHINIVSIHTVCVCVLCLPCISLNNWHSLPLHIHLEPAFFTVPYYCIVAICCYVGSVLNSFIQNHI